MARTKKEIDQIVLLQRDREDLEGLENYIEEFSLFLPLPVCTVNPLGIIIGINRAVGALVGYNEMEIVGKGADVLFLDKGAFISFEKEILKGKTIQGKEMILVDKDQKKVPVNMYSSLRKDKQGIIIGYFLAFSDITELKNVQEELEEQIEELEKLQRIAVGRELKMIEFKEEIEILRRDLDKIKKGLKIN